MNSKTITIEMGDSLLSFTVTLEEWTRCVNALNVDNKVGPMHNFLIRVANNDDTKKLVNQAYQDGLTCDLFGVLVQEFKPDVEIRVKKYKTAPDKLNKTV